jgi:hypothetical protein
MLLPTQEMRIKTTIKNKEIGVWERGGSKPMDTYKLATKDHVFEHTSMRAWRVSGWNSLVVQNGFQVLKIDMEDMFVQLLKTSS